MDDIIKLQVCHAPLPCYTPYHPSPCYTSYHVTMLQLDTRSDTMDGEGQTLATTKACPLIPTLIPALTVTVTLTVTLTPTMLKVSIYNSNPDPDPDP